MLKVWNSHENRWDPTDQAGAERARARGQRVIERPDPAPVELIEVELVDEDPDAPNAALAALTIEQLAGLARIDEPSPAAPAETGSGDGAAEPAGVTSAEALAPITLEFDSSNVKSASFDPATGIVTVAFKSGSPFRYANFTAELMAAWGAAASAGSWFHHNVRQRSAQHPIVPDAQPTGGE